MKTKKDSLERIFALISVIFLVTGILTYQFYITKVKPYHEGYQNIPTYPKFQSFPTDRFIIEYVPDYPNSGDMLAVYIKVDLLTGRNFHCKNCILTGYFIGDDGTKNYLFKNLTSSDEGIRFTYPGKQVTILMSQSNLDFKFYIPQPSLMQSLNLVLNDNPIFTLILFLFSISGISLIGIIAYIKNIRA